MSGLGKGLVGFLIARPLIAVVIAAAVAELHLLLVGEADALEYAKTLRQYRARIVASGTAYSEVQRVAKRIEAVAGRDKPNFVWKVTLLRKNEANGSGPSASGR